MVTPLPYPVSLYPSGLPYRRASTRVAQRAFPDGSAAWASAFPALTAPLALWTCQQSASPLTDGIGSHALVQNQAILYSVVSDPEPTLAPRLAIEFDTTDSNEFTADSDTAFADLPSGAGRSMWLRFRAPDNGAAGRSIGGSGSSAAAARWGLQLVATSGLLRASASDGTTTINANSLAAADDGGWHDGFLIWDRTAGTPALRVALDAEALQSTNLGALSAVDSATGFRLGACLGLLALAGVRVSYAALFGYALTAGNITTIRTPI